MLFLLKDFKTTEMSFISGSLITRSTQFEAMVCSFYLEHKRQMWRHAQSGLTVHSNLAISLYNSLCNDNKAASTLPLIKQSNYKLTT